MRKLLDRGLCGSGPIVFLTGAGVSAESGIPTFRGEEGYWTVGSREYRPEELATQAAFRAMPLEVWSWYLYRRSICLGAEPNAAHHALSDLEHGFHDRLLLITQNVDGLHLRAGSSEHLTYQIHGNLDYIRFDDSGDARLYPMPQSVPHQWPKGQLPSGQVLEALTHRDGKLGRPHVLWFDEYYDEALFRFQSSIRAASEASLLVIVGTSGATNLPIQVAQTALHRNSSVIALNKDPQTAFAEVGQMPYGYFQLGLATEWIPAIARYMMQGL